MKKINKLAMAFAIVAIFSLIACSSDKSDSCSCSCSDSDFEKYIFEYITGYESKLVDVDSTFNKKIEEYKETDDVKAAMEKYNNALKKLNEEYELSQDEIKVLSEDKDYKDSKEALDKALEEAQKKYPESFM